MDKEQLFKKALKKADYSITKTRLETFRIVSKKGPITISELTGELSQIDRASIYRTVKLFEELNIIKRIYTGWKYKIEIGEAFSPHHHHLICTKCQKTIAFKEPRSVDLLIQQIVKENDFKETGHQFEIIGMCKDCKK